MISPHPEVSEYVERVVTIFHRGIICQAVFWDYLIDRFTEERLFGDVEPVLDALPTSTQEALRRIYAGRPHSLCGQGCGEFYRRVVQAWCQQPPPVA